MSKKDDVNKYLDFQNQKHHYKVILLAPRDLEGVKNAQGIIEATLDLLNKHTLEPGLRFGDNVTAEVEVSHDMEQVNKRLQREKDIALVIGCYEKEQLGALALSCQKHDVGFCHARVTSPEEAVPIQQQQAEHLGNDPHVHHVRVLTAEETQELHKRQLPGHILELSTLTDPPPASEEVLQTRVRWILSVLAIGVMQSHFGRGSSLE